MVWRGHLDAATVVAQKLNYVFRNEQLLHQALTHSTYANELPALCGAQRRQQAMMHSYERLEFLGDAVLQLLTSDHLYGRLPEAGEGALSRRRAQLVREPTLAALAHELGLAPLVRLGGSQADAPVPISILADVVEAVLAAVYLDGGLPAAVQVFAPLMARLHVLGDVHVDHKTQLQEACHTLHLPQPIYEVSEVQGPPHARTFFVTLTVGDTVCTRGDGSSKKAAEQLCARGALSALGLLQQS